MAVAVFVIGLAVAYAVNRAWPQLEFVSIFLGVFLVIGVTIMVPRAVGRWWSALVLPGAALAALGLVLLAQNQALASAGQRVEVIVTAHTVDKGTNGDGTRYETQHYKLSRTDGRPLNREMDYRGSGGYDGVKVGSRITVLVDPSGRAPIRPASEVDPGADIGIAVFGGVLLCGALIPCAVSVRRASRKPENLAAAS